MTPLHAGDILDDYRIERLVARSGMASIWKATDTRDGKPVAIKIPHEEMECDVQFFERFQREAEIGKSMDHPGVMKVYHNPKQSRIYMVMEWVEGRLLRHIMHEQHKLTQDRAIHLTLAILDALEYIHGRGVAHRDLKPENIMVDEQDRIKLIDFGIASLEGARRLTFAKLTNVMGTPDYISPEQVKGKRGDGRSDLYSMGVMLYEMLTGKTPFSGPNPFQIMNDRLLNNPVPPREIDPAIWPEVQEIIYRALERDPAKRYRSAREFAKDLASPEQVGVADRAELTNWQVRKSSRVRQVAFYVGLALIPVVVLGLLFWVARHT
jgi:eukaryotic-like serine/threonine-protein kinase